MFKINNKEKNHCCSGFYIFNFKHISHLALVFLLLTLSRRMPARFLSMNWSVSVAKFLNEQPQKLLTDKS